MKKISRRARKHAITLYNYVSSTNGVASYQRSVLEHVYFDKTYQQRLSTRGIQTADAAQLIVELSDFKATDDRTYIAPELWTQISAEQRALSFTFRSADDFYVEGVVAETLPNTTKAEMLKKYRCYAISSCGIPSCGSPTSGIVVVTAK